MPKNPKRGAVSSRSPFAYYILCIYYSLSGVFTSLLTCSSFGIVALNRHYSASPPNAPPNSATVLTLLAFECAPFVPLCGIGGAHPFAITIPITMRSYIGYGYILRIYYTNLVNLTAVKYNGGRNYKHPATKNDQRYSHTTSLHPSPHSAGHMHD